MNTLIYVDRDLILPIAVKLIGSSVTVGENTSGQVGFNFFVAAALGMTEESATETRLADLFPEDLLHESYPAITQSNLTIPDFAGKISTGEIQPPEVVTVSGKLVLPDPPGDFYDPFDPPQIAPRRQYRFYQYRTFVGTLEQRDFTIPVHFLANGAEMIYYANNLPVELVGVVKWTPAYEVAGHAVNATILCAALLLRRT